MTSFGWFEADDVARVALRGNDFRPAGGASCCMAWAPARPRWCAPWPI
ncbi:MAG: hypothetical protein R3F43_04280 [bacterium]